MVCWEVGEDLNTPPQTDYTLTCTKYKQCYVHGILVKVIRNLNELENVPLQEKIICLNFVRFQHEFYFFCFRKIHLH